MRSTFKVLFYLKKDKHKVQPVVPVMGRITVNGTIAQFSAKLSIPPHLWEVKGGRAKGKSLEANRKTTNTIFHASLNPSPEDKLTDEQLCVIAQKYMEHMGYGKQPYIVFTHRDIDRKHLHVVSLRIDENGRKLSHDYEVRRSMDILRSLVQKYGLHPSIKG